MSVKQMALGGVTAALAIVILCLGGLVPFATYVLPMICCILLWLILPTIGVKGGWVWYFCVSFLSVLLCPDKEAAAVVVFLGFYPLVKSDLDLKAWGWVGKFFLFNASSFVMYFALIYLFGFSALAMEVKEMGLLLGAITLILGNLCFFLLDRVLSRFVRK